MAPPIARGVELQGREKGMAGEGRDRSQGVRVGTGGKRESACEIRRRRRVVPAALLE